MTDDASIFAGLVQVLREHVQFQGEVRGDMGLQADLGLDSLQQLTFIVEAENLFAMCFAPEAEAELRSIDDLVGYIRRVKASQISSRGAGADGTSA